MTTIKAQTVPPFNIALVVSEFNETITLRLYEAAMQQLESLAFSSDLITTVYVPGAVEIPLVAKRLAATQKFQAIVALGAVIKGDTDHYHWVCEQASQGCQRVGFEYNLPVVFGVLTTDNEQQAWDRSGGQHSNKGQAAINTACNMVSILQQL